MANLFKVGEKVLNKVMHSSQKEDLRLSEGSTLLYHNYMELGNFMSIITNNVRESVSQTQRLTLLNKDLASSIHQHVSGNLRESFEIQAATEKLNNIHASVVNEHLMEFFNALELQLIKPLLREKESENDLKKILDERKRLVQDFDSTKKLVQNTYDPDKVQTLEAKLGQLKKRLDTQADQLTDQLASRNQERAVTIAKSILALMEAQQSYYQSTATLFSDVNPIVAPLLQQLSQITKQAPANPAPQQPINQSAPQPKATQTPTQRPASTSAPQQPASQSLRQQQTPPPQQQPKPEPPKQAVPAQPQPSPQPPINMQPAPAAPIQQAPVVPSPSPAPSQPAQSLNLFDDIPAPKPKQDSNTLFNLDDDFGSPSSQPAASSSNDFFNTFSSTTSPSQNGAHKNDVFDSFSSFTPVTTKSPQPVPSHDPFGGFFSTTPGTAPTPTSTPVQPQAQAQKSSTGSPASSNYNKEPGELGFDPVTGAAIKKKTYIAPARDVLTEMKERDQSEEAEREKRRELDDVITAKVNQWVSGRKGNLRALLSTLDTILWEDSGWKTVTIGELLPPNKLKIAYRKAQLIVHSDKMIGKSLDHRLLAERVFDMLIDAAKNEEGL